MAKAANSIAILGAGGSMGTWFSKYFIALKYSVTGFDSENAIKVKGFLLRYQQDMHHASHFAMRRIISGVLRAGVHNNT